MPYTPVQSSAIGEEMCHSAGVAAGEGITATSDRIQVEGILRIIAICGNPIIIIEHDGMISSANDAFLQMSGYSRGEVEGALNWKEFARVTLDASHAEAVPAGQNNGTPGLLVRFTDKQGKEKIVTGNVRQIGADGRAILSLTDITGLKHAEEEIRSLNSRLEKVNAELRSEIADRKVVEQVLLHQASHDSLTGLPNRDLLMDRLKQAFAFEDRHKKLLAIMLLDLDNFKQVNDSLGHLAGDLLLKEVATRMQQCMRQYDTVARLGGDEFVIILTDINETADIPRFASKICQVLHRPFAILGHTVEISTSIGVAVYPLHGTSAESLLKMADCAMYRVKGEGKNSFCMYSPDMTFRSSSDHALSASIGEAIERGEFVPYYQPSFDARTGLISGTEVLLRWMPGDGAVRFPAEFLADVQQSGLVLKLEDVLLDRVCRQLNEWNTTGVPLARVGVNISESGFRSGDLTRRVCRAADRHGIRPEQLEVQVAEEILLHNPSESLQTLLDLKTAGIRIAVDHFGAGRSSLRFLSRFPVDLLVLDRSIVSGIAGGANDASVAAAAIAIGRCLGSRVGAQGVESAEQHRFLVRHGCDDLQGFLFSPPVPADAFANLVLLLKRGAAGMASAGRSGSPGHCFS